MYVKGQIGLRNNACSEQFKLILIMFKGTCKWYNTVKGYGFIIPDELGDDIFCHQSSILCESLTGFISLTEG